MPRRSRRDQAGAWHHVMNRGLARRTVFESREDVRYFLSRLAHIVRRGGFELHAWCVMTTHFHLLVRSVSGDLPAAMQWSQDLYARWFNRRRRRDGPLFRGRYRSKLVESEAHWFAVVRYIDGNPIQARMVSRSADYRHGSARDYANATGPAWLTRSSVEQAVRRSLGKEEYAAADYARVFGGEASPSERYIAQRGIEAGAPIPASLDDLVDAAPARVLSWMRRKAALADGTPPGIPVVSPTTVRSIVAEHREADPGRELCPGDKRPVWNILESGLLRCASGYRFAEIGAASAVSAQTARTRTRQHSEAVGQNSDYEELCASVLAEAIARDYRGAGVRGGRGVMARPG